VAQEASAVNECALLASELPANMPAEMRGQLKKYVQFVMEQDQPAMLAGRVNLQQLPPGLTDAMALLLSFTPTDAAQRMGQERSEAALERILEARRDRIVLSESTIAPIQWTVILILTVLVLVVIAIVHLDRPITAAANLFIFSTAVAVCLILLMVNDHPFSRGGINADLTTLQQVVPTD
jgi:Protein of unknown function (DUF4239)